MAGTGGDRLSRHEEVRLTHHDREGWLRAVQRKERHRVYRDGVHYVNGTLVGTPAALLRHPEALVYAPERGHLRLAALEYVVLKSAWDQAHGKNAPRGCMGTGSISPMRPTVTDSRRSTRCMPGS